LLGAYYKEIKHVFRVIMNGSIFQSAPLLMILRAEAGEVTEIVVRLLIQLAVILFAAKLAGEIAVRYLKLPPVLAELGAGVVIGPFALGGIAIPGFGPLFPIPEVDGVPSVIPVSNELFALAQLGSIFLLFAIGLETNLRQFLRYAAPATAVALGGLILPFGLGVGPQCC
jgi:Kef-type K+ transport system membrane component KefB